MAIEMYGLTKEQKDKIYAKRRSDRERYYQNHILGNRKYITFEMTPELRERLTNVLKKNNITLKEFFLKGYEEIKNERK